jgi:hypothetical protein
MRGTIFISCGQFTEAEYCTVCASADHGGIGAIVAEVRLSARVWIDKQEYAVEKTIKELAMDRDDS